MDATYISANDSKYRTINLMLNLTDAEILTQALAVAYGAMPLPILDRLRAHLELAMEDAAADAQGVKP